MAQPAGDFWDGRERAGRARPLRARALRRPYNYAYVILAIAAVVRLVLAAMVPLVPDEAYYWEWSRHLAAGYFDHPPVIAWLVRAGTMVFGDTNIGVRIGSILAGFIACAATVALANRIGGAKAAQRTAIIISVMPLAAVGFMLATPDAPLMAACAVMLWAIDKEQWIVAGIAFGIAMDSKYTAVLVAAGVAIAFLTNRSLRRLWLTPGPYIALAIAIVLMIPVLRWNAAHGWISFTFQAHHGLVTHRGSTFNREMSLLGSQAALLSPILFVLAVIAVACALKKPISPMQFTLAVVATFITVFFIWSARHSVSPNWLAPAVLPAVIVLATRDTTPPAQRWERWGIALATVMTLVIYVHGLTPILPINPRSDVVAQAYGWDELATAVQQHPAQWIAADRYQDAAELAWHLKTHPEVFSLNLGGRANQYDLWPTLKEQIHTGDSLTVVLDDSGRLPPDVTILSPHFASTTSGPLVEMHRAGTVIARRRIWQFFDLISPL